MALLIMNKDAIKRHPRLAAKATKRLTRTPSPHIEECAGCGVSHVLDCIGNGMYLQPPHDCNFTRVVRLSRFEIMVAQS